jgi:hypothetical protein
MRVGKAERLTIVHSQTRECRVLREAFAEILFADGGIHPLQV